MAGTLSRRSILKSTGLSLGGLAATGVFAGSGLANPAFAKEAAKKAVSGTPDFLIGPKPGVADLSRNENPYGPAPSALKTMEYAGSRGAYYPTSIQQRLAEMIAERNNVSADHVIVTTGSSEALCAISVMLGRDGPAVVPALFFDHPVSYAVGLKLASMKPVPMTNGLLMDLPALEAAVTDETGLVVINNPNNPTGEFIEGSVLKPYVSRMAKKAPVIVDEAYMEIADNPEKNTCVDLVRAGENVIVTRTFSKIYGMAGLRVGYAIAQPEVIQRIGRARMTWGSGPGFAAAVASYNDEAFLKASLSKIREGKEMVMSALSDLELEAIPSGANFVYFKTDRKADDVRDAFAKKDVVVRGKYFDYEGWTRVSMGRLDDLEKFAKALPQAIGA
ncbi:MAG: histidinol-phosphate transaminase [Pseudomonadota bacterium]